MVATLRRRSPEIFETANGPWKGVVTTNDPLDSGDDVLLDATNGYIPSPEGPSGWYVRPGMTAMNAGVALVTQATPFRGQGVISHTDLSDTSYRFVVFAGKLFREDAQFSAGTDVSPVGITIDPSVTTRVYGTSFGNQLVITDGVNRPWLATNLSSTPITGTYIDYDGMGTTWAAFGPMRLYAGSFFCILSQVNSISRRTDVSWSAPGDASIGWQQTNYDFNWTLGQTEADPLYALFGTNTGLVYWRERSIGLIAGVPGPNLQTSHTDDAISRNIGCTSPQTVVPYGTILYFCDALGRPYRWVPGNDPEPIWLQMRGIVASSTVGQSGVTKTVASAAYEATMNVYVVAIWSTIPGQSGPPVEGYIFDMRTGRYFGRFKVADGIQIETLGTFPDVNGRSTMVVLGSATAPTSSALAASGYVWGIKSLEAIGDFLTTEAGVFLTTEDGVQLTTEGTASSNWMDGSTVPTISITTPKFGYALDKVITVDRASALTSGDSPVTVSALTAAMAQTVEGTPTPSTSQDDVGKVTVGFSGVQGRGVTITVSPTTATTQFVIQSVGVQGVLNNANPDEV